MNRDEQWILWQARFSAAGVHLWLECDDGRPSSRSAFSACNDGRYRRCCAICRFRGILEVSHQIFPVRHEPRAEEESSPTSSGILISTAPFCATVSRTRSISSFSTPVQRRLRSSSRTLRTSGIPSIRAFRISVTWRCAAITAWAMCGSIGSRPTGSAPGVMSASSFSAPMAISRSLNRTHVARDQEECLLAAELFLKAQKNTKFVTLKD